MRHRFMVSTAMLWAFLTFVLSPSLTALNAQVHAHMKLWDQKFRFPRINSIEFKGDEPSLATYDALYGHGAMWENEWMGFRVYMDHRQSIDLYGKKQSRLELDSTNFYTTALQWQSGYGEDVLFVGSSIGAGSFRGCDSDGRLEFVSPVAARGQRILSEGPDTAVVEIYATGWQRPDGRLFDFRQRFTALRGHREVQVDVWVEGACDTDTFATGVQKFEFNTSGTMLSDGLVASWGSNVPDKQGNPDRVHTLGMAVRVSPDNLLEVREDDLNYLCLMHPARGHMRYWLITCSDLQGQGGFHTAREWFDWAKTQSFSPVP